MKNGKRRVCATGESSAFLRSFGEITVCGCQRVLHYSTDTVRLMLTDGIMEIEGRDISASTYFGREIRLTGRIENIRLTGGQKER